MIQQIYCLLKEGQTNVDDKQIFEVKQTFLLRHLAFSCFYLGELWLFKFADMLDILVYFKEIHQRL